VCGVFTFLFITSVYKRIRGNLTYRIYKTSVADSNTIPIYRYRHFTRRRIIWCASPRVCIYLQNITSSYWNRNGPSIQFIVNDNVFRVFFSPSIHFYVPGMHNTRWAVVIVVSWLLQRPTRVFPMRFRYVFCARTARYVITCTPAAGSGVKRYIIAFGSPVIAFDY